MTKRHVSLAVLFFAMALIMPYRAMALTISPVKIEVTGDPGQTLTGDLELYNEQADQETLYSSTDNFEARGETGVPFFLSEKTGLASWIKTDDKVILKSKETKKIAYTITIPKNAEPGGYFSAILWGMTPPGATAAGQVSVGGRLGVLILLKVSGQVKEGGGLLDFNASKKISSSLPISFSFLFNNTGGDRTVPQGDVTVKNLFGFTDVVIPSNPNQGSVLPGSMRKFEVLWGDTGTTDNTGFFSAAGQQWSDFHFGFYTASIKITYGLSGQVANASYSFFIVPWQLLLIIAIVLFVVGFFSKIGIKKYNRWIIAKARQ